MTAFTRMLKSLFSGAPRAARVVRKTRLGMEPLEAREVPAAVTATLLSGGLLQIRGTAADDTIYLRQPTAGQLAVDGVTIAGPTGTAAQVPLDQVNRIEILGLGGADTIRLDQSPVPILLPALIDGGSGNDYLRGGDGPDVLVGGPGDDYLRGRGGNDVLIGDEGLDQLIGDAGTNRLYENTSTGSRGLHVGGAGSGVRSVVVEPSGSVLVLDTTGESRRIAAGTETVLGTGVTKVVSAPTGAAYLKSDGLLVVENLGSWSNTKDFAVADNGTLYWLGTRGVFQSRPVGGGWQNVSSTVSSFQVSGNHVVWLEGGSAGRLYEQPLGGSYRQLSSTVRSFQVADGRIVWLEGGSAGRLYEQPLGGSYRQISSTVRSFQVAGGYVVWLEGTEGRLYEQPLGGSYRQISRSVSSFQVADGRVVWLEGGSAGRLYEQPLGGSYRQLSSTVTQFAVADGRIVWLEGAEGRLYEQPLGGSYRQISRSVSDFQVVGGYVVWLEGGSAGRLYEQPLGGSYRQLSSTVSDFQVSGGYVVWLEGSAGRLYEQPLGGSYRQLSSTVSQFTVVDGRIVWLEGGAAGRLYEQPLGGSYRQIGSAIKQFTIDTFGTLYVLNQSGLLQRLRAWSSTWEGNWANTKDFAVDSYGSLYVLNVSGLLQRLRAWSSTWEGNWANTKDFDLDALDRLLVVNVNGRLQRLDGTGWTDLDFCVESIDLDAAGELQIEYTPIGRAYHDSDPQTREALGEPIGGLYTTADGKVVQQFQNGVIAWDGVYGARVLSRPTLVIITHGFGVTRDASDGWVVPLAEQVREGLWARGSSSVVWTVSWNARDPGGDAGLAQALADRIRTFLDGQSETWDVLVIGHSRGAILNNSAFRLLGDHSRAGYVQMVMLDPTASTHVHGDDYPGQVAGVVDRAVHYDDDREVDHDLVQIAVSMIPYVGPVLAAIREGTPGQILNGIAGQLDGGWADRFCEEAAWLMGWVQTHTQVTEEGVLPGPGTPNYQYVNVHEDPNLIPVELTEAEKVAAITDFAAGLPGFAEGITRALAFMGWMNDTMPGFLKELSNFDASYASYAIHLTNAYVAIRSHMRFGAWYPEQRLGGDLDQLVGTKPQALGYHPSGTEQILLSGNW